MGTSRPLSWLRFGPMPTSEGVGSGGIDDVFRFLSWNVRYFSHHTRGLASTEANLKRISTAIADMDPQPDIIALQEIDDLSVRSQISRARRWRSHEPASNFDRFVHQLNHHSSAVGGHVYQAQFYPAQGHVGRLPLYSTGLAILFRNTLEQLDHNGDAPHDITHRRLQKLSKIKQKRICAWARFRDEGGRTFDVFNTHLSLPAFLQRHNGPTGKRFGEAENQVREADAILEFMTERGATTDGGILAGDFNAVPGSRVYRQFTGEASLKDAHASVLGASPEELAGFPSAGFMRLRYRLDHIFTRGDVSFSCFDGTEPFGKDHPLAGLSDHMPLVGRFHIG